MASSASSGFVDNWQAGKTLAECNLRMFQEEDSHDVTFRCGTEGHVMKAHTYMLISRSCVFHAMLTGVMAEKSDVTIPDIEPLVFKTFLKYIYTDRTDIDADNVIALLYAARKYGVSALETKCTEFLDFNLSSENACVILEAAHRFDQKHLFQKALTFIKAQGSRSLQAPGFLVLSQDFVGEIVGSDDLVADEHVIFTAVNDWSEAECGREGKEVTPESKRSILGGLLKKVRFPIMKPAFLANTVKRSGLLTDSERIMCLDFAAEPEESSTTFITKKRGSTLLSRSVSKSRFCKVYSNVAWYRTGKIDAIRFSTNSHLTILGCQLYAGHQRKGKNTYNVISYLGDEDNVLSCVVQERSEYTCEGEVFDVIFSRPVSVKAGEWYTLAVEIQEGPMNSLRGYEGQDKVVREDGVILKFRNSKHSDNGTTTDGGQIPSLLYKKQ